MHNPMVAWRLKWADVRRTHVNTVYEQALGNRFMHLPAAIQVMHSRVTKMSGRVDVQHGEHWLARTVAHWLGLPAAAEHQPLTVRFERTSDTEIWRRSFAGHLLISKQYCENGYLREQFGPLQLAFALNTDGQTLDIHLRQARLFGIRLPKTWQPKLTAQEWPLGDGVGFSVNVTLPLIGLLIRYVGAVRPPGRPAAG